MPKKKGLHQRPLMKPVKSQDFLHTPAQLLSALPIRIMLTITRTTTLARRLKTFIVVFWYQI